MDRGILPLHHAIDKRLQHWMNTCKIEG